MATTVQIDDGNGGTCNVPIGGYTVAGDHDIEVVGNGLVGVQKASGVPVIVSSDLIAAFATSRLRAKTPDNSVWAFGWSAPSGGSTIFTSGSVLGGGGIVIDSGFKPNTKYVLALKWGSITVRSPAVPNTPNRDITVNAKIAVGRVTDVNSTFVFPLRTWDAELLSSEVDISEVFPISNLPTSTTATVDNDWTLIEFTTGADASNITLMGKMSSDYTPTPTAPEYDDCGFGQAVFKDMILMEIA